MPVSESVKNLGVTLDQHMTLEKQGSSTLKLLILFEKYWLFDLLFKF